MKTLQINASKKYNVIIDKGLSSFKSQILPLIKGGKVAIVTDSNVEPLYYNLIANLLSDKTIYKIVIKAGEKSKNVKNYLKIIDDLSNLGFSRNSCVIGLGGGVIGDLAAFASSTYMRGINYIAIPTTLLSMVDSSVGGKTGVDLKAGKNLLGTFYQPTAVYINVDFLSTLPSREILCGKGEIIKYLFIDSKISVSDIAECDYESLIYKCLDIKREIVENDEKEAGNRMLLNFGHTVGHALEKLYNYKLSHGECVIKGMYYSLKASFNLGYINKQNYYEATKILKETGVSLKDKFTKAQILKAMKSDKKSDGELVNFVFSKGFANPLIKKLPLKEVLENI